MAANKNLKKPNVTPKASEIEVKTSEEIMVNDDVVTDDVVTDGAVTDVAETVETSDVKNPTEDEVTINEDETVAVPAERKVKVRLRENHRCHIGGETYDFKKGQVALVPEFVKSVLAKADLLQSL